MATYKWALGNGDIIEAEYDQSTDSLSNEQVKKELQEIFSQYDHKVECREVNSLKEVFLISFKKDVGRSPLLVCAKGTTPGGRSILKDEQRIQQKSKYINYVYRKQQEGEQAIQLGVYRRDGQTVICAWLIKKSISHKDTPISKQIKITTIAKAMKEGFAQQDKGSGEYACAFRKEFIYFYISNSNWLHRSLITEMAEHSAPIVEDDERSDINFNTGFESDFPRNRIFFGAPGTGKSFTLEKERKALLGGDNDKNYERVTFHPDYSYANFVGTYKPVMVKTENWVTKCSGKEEVLTTLLDDSITAQEKYDLLYEKFRDNSLSDLSLLLSLYTDETFTARDKNGTATIKDNNVELIYGKTIRPYINLLNDVVPSNDIAYEYVPGPFMRVYAEALRSSKLGNIQPFLLIVEEINRANVAGVFGDIFQLLDRDKDEVSEYSIQASEDIKKYLAKELGGEPNNYDRIKIPDNMFIWATMNSADQGVFPMDTAFKRRWSFDYLGIDDSEKDIIGKIVPIGEGANLRYVEWNELRKAINDKLANLKINEDKLLGPYFLSKHSIFDGDGIDHQKFNRVFKNKVLMYLFEDAAKQKRQSLFADDVDHMRYSAVCHSFDDKGVFVFCSEISNKFTSTVPPENAEGKTE